MPERLAQKQDQTNTILGEGQAALWLTESLILALLEANLLDTDTILEAIDTVIAAKRAKAAEGSERDVAQAAITHLASISESHRRSGGSKTRSRRRQETLDLKLSARESYSPKR